MPENELSSILKGTGIAVERKEGIRYLGYRGTEVKGEVEAILVKEIEEALTAFFEKRETRFTGK